MLKSHDTVMQTYNHDLRHLITMRSHRLYDIITIYIIILLFLCVQFTIRKPFDVELGFDRLTVHRFPRVNHVYAWSYNNNILHNVMSVHLSRNGFGNAEKRPVDNNLSSVIVVILYYYYDYTIAYKVIYIFEPIRGYFSYRRFFEFSKKTNIFSTYFFWLLLILCC